MDSSEVLRALVTQHTVRYEIWPHYDIYEGKQVKDGYDLELCGTHDNGHSRMTPGCNLCQLTYRDLQKIAEAVLPRDERLSRYDISPFDNALHGNPRGTFDVVLPIGIRHRNQYFSAVDACEDKCLAEMTTRLKELGVARGSLNK